MDKRKPLKTSGKPEVKPVAKPVAPVAKPAAPAGKPVGKK